MAILPHHPPLLTSRVSQAVAQVLVRAYALWTGSRAVELEHLRDSRQRQIREMAAAAVTRLSPTRVHLAHTLAGQQATATLTQWLSEHSYLDEHYTEDDMEELGYRLACEIDTAVNRSLRAGSPLDVGETCPQCGRANELGTHGHEVCTWD